MLCREALLLLLGHPSHVSMDRITRGAAMLMLINAGHGCSCGALSWQTCLTSFRGAWLGAHSSHIWHWNMVKRPVHVFFWHS